MAKFENIAYIVLKKRDQTAALPKLIWLETVPPSRFFYDISWTAVVNYQYQAGAYLEETHDLTAEEDQGVIEAWRARLRKRKVYFEFDSLSKIFTKVITPL